MNQLKYIKSLVEEYTGEDLNDISRKREVVSARWMYCYLAKSHTHYSDKVIGHPIKRDRASVIVHIKGLQTGLDGSRKPQRFIKPLMR